jgi:cytochrome c oxidase subunit 4
MTEVAHHEPHGEGTAEHEHPGAGVYVRIGTLLTVITAAEVAIFYIPAMRQFLVPTLLALSGLKFVLVVMFYMHLKFDHPAFTWLFVLGMAIAMVIIVALMLLFDAFERFHQLH